jgi:FkbM family methyltransferase
MVPPVQWQQSGRHTPQLWTEQRPQIERVFDLLADQPSRQILASIVKARIEGDTGFHRISPFQEYDHPVVHAGRGDVVVDVGAYDGDSAELYAQRVGPGGRVVAMEPSPANYGKMIQRMRQQRLENITPLLLGAWNDDAVLRFEDGAGVSSKLGSEGKTQVVVTPIDRLVGDYRLPRVDLIKLDVEGAEKAALEGARDTILRFRPQLHISIYHRFDDIFELPLMLAEWLPRYRWYMGHHSYYQMETDLYGVPVERWMRRRVWRVGRKLLRQAGRRFTRQSPSAPDKALSGGA